MKKCSLYLYLHAEKPLFIGLENEKRKGKNWERGTSLHLDASIFALHVASPVSSICSPVSFSFSGQLWSECRAPLFTSLSALAQG
ncbi:hypothetical protein VIGAN_05186300 [Vigna angularis var. angularis]|uniref:Uncharacterized protein n=1 Tax=Vigna angularis var. angularis TaxID=157739 RepID=A0A0S3S6A0_PHAAN|nr:hypothetical protein VIGAN_05186300 [Vigna angularis var. angularis]